MTEIAYARANRVKVSRAPYGNAWGSTEFWEGTEQKLPKTTETLSSQVLTAVLATLDD